MRMQEIVEAIKTLSLTDRHHLRKLLEAQDEADKLEIFHQVLLSQGLVKEVKKPHVTARLNGNSLRSRENLSQKQLLRSGSEPSNNSTAFINLHTRRGFL